MNEDGFRAYLGRRLTARSVGSYLSNARRVEHVLGIDLQQAAAAGGCQLLELQLAAKRSEFTAGSLADCLTALRTYFKYAATASGASPASVIAAQPQPKSPAMPIRGEAHAGLAPKYSALLKEASVRDLLALHGGVITELRNREVVRTSNSPLGDYAEYLFCKAFRWTLNTNSASGYDAALNGIRYQIKGRRIGASNPSRQLGDIRRLPEKPFDVLAAVLFDEEYNVTKAILIPHVRVLEKAKHIEHTSSWRVMLDDRWWSAPGVTDVTTDLQNVQA